MGRKARLKPMKIIQNAARPAPSSMQPPGHLWKPDVQRAEHREEIDADQHVVDVGQDEIGVGELQVGRHRGRHDAGNAADHEHDDEGGVVQEGAGHDGPPGPDGCDPGEHRNRARDRDREGRAAEEGERQERNAGCEHVMQPDAEAERHGRDGAEHDGRIADQRAAAEERQRRRTPCPIAGSTTT